MTLIQRFGSALNLNIHFYMLFLDGVCIAAAAPVFRHVLFFGVEINTCARCGGKLKVIASIEEPEVIAKILAHLEKAAPDQSRAELPLGARPRRPRHD